MVLKNLNIAQMRSSVQFMVNNATAAATADRAAIDVAGKNDNYTLLLTTRGKLRKKNGDRSLLAGLIESKETFELICRFQSTLESNLRSDVKIIIDNKTYTISSWEKVDEIKHWYMFLLNASSETYNQSLGPELVTNGSFSGNAAGWSLGSDWFYDTNKITHNPVNTLVTFQPGTLDDTKTYRVSLNISGTDGFVGVYLGHGLSASGVFAAGRGDVSFNASWYNDVTLIEFHPDITFNGSITNVSVKEII